MPIKKVKMAYLWKRNKMALVD